MRRRLVNTVKQNDPEIDNIEEEQYDKQQEPIVLSKITSDIFLKQENPAELIALYWFYYYTAKWQGTNQAKATTLYAAKGLKWSENKVRRVKKQLIKLELIEDRRGERNKKGAFGNCYIYVKFIWWNKEKINKFNDNDPQHFPQGGKTDTVVDYKGNALSTNNLNALRTNNLNSLNTYTIFLEKWNENKIIFHKKITSKRKTAIDKVEKLKDYTQEEIFKAFQNYATILHSPNYFWNYTWSLEDFLQRGLHKFVDEANPLINFLDKKNKQQEKIVDANKIYGNPPKYTPEYWTEIFQKQTDALLQQKELWSSLPSEVLIFNKVVQIQVWIDNLDFSVYGGRNIQMAIGDLKGFFSQFVDFIRSKKWTIVDKSLDVNSKVFNLFVADMETAFPADVTIKSNGWKKNKI